MTIPLPPVERPSKVYLYLWLIYRNAVSRRFDCTSITLNLDYAEICRAIVINLSANNAAHLHQHMFEPRWPGRTVSSLLKLARLVAAAAGSSSATATDLTLDGVSFFDVVIG
jgi:hypothetical protein